VHAAEDRVVMCDRCVIFFSRQLAFLVAATFSAYCVGLKTTLVGDTTCGAGRIAIGQFLSRDRSAFCYFLQQFVYNNPEP